MNCIFDVLPLSRFGWVDVLGWGEDGLGTSWWVPSQQQGPIISVGTKIISINFLCNQMKKTMLTFKYEFHKSCRASRMKASSKHYTQKKILYEMLISKPTMNRLSTSDRVFSINDKYKVSLLTEFNRLQMA